MSHFLGLARVQLIFNMEVVYMCYRDLLLKNEFLGVFSSKLITSPALIVIQTVNGHVAVENFRSYNKRNPTKSVGCTAMFRLSGLNL